MKTMHEPIPNRYSTLISELKIKVSDFDIFIDTCDSDPGVR